MNLEDQVVSLNLAKRLKEIGCKQESLFCWLEHLDAYLNPYEFIIADQKEFRLYCEDVENPEFYAAYTVAELGLMLIRYPVETYHTFDEFNLVYNEHNRYKEPIYVKDQNEANARAKMIIHLIENGLMEVP